MQLAKMNKGLQKYARKYTEELSRAAPYVEFYEKTISKNKIGYGVLHFRILLLFLSIAKYLPCLRVDFYL